MLGSAAAGSEGGCGGVQSLCSALRCTSPTALLGARMCASVRACAQACEHMCTHLDTHTCPLRGRCAGNTNKAQLKEMGGTALQRLGGFPCFFSFCTLRRHLQHRGGGSARIGGGSAEPRCLSQRGLAPPAVPLFPSPGWGSLPRGAGRGGSPRGWCRDGAMKG